MRSSGQSDDTKMNEPEISSAFEAISQAVRNVEEVIAPGITDVAHGLPNDEIEKALLDFHTRAMQHKPDG